MNLTAERISAAVKEQARRHGFDVATNDGYNRAYELAKRTHPALFAANEMPDQANLTPDGQSLVPDWPVPVEVLAKLSLPAKATREQYQLYQLAEQTEVTPEIAAVMVRAVIQYSQLARAISFDEALEHFQKHRPEIYRAAAEAARSQT